MLCMEDLMSRGLVAEFEVMRGVFFWQKALFAYAWIPSTPPTGDNFDLGNYFLTSKIASHRLFLSWLKFSYCACTWSLHTMYFGIGPGDCFPSFY